MNLSSESCSQYRSSSYFWEVFNVMFEDRGFRRSLDEETFNRWLENGRSSRMGYLYLLVVWDDYEAAYQPVYVTHRDEITSYKTAQSRERFIAAYDLYSESRIV